MTKPATEFEHNGYRLRVSRRSRSGGYDCAVIRRPYWPELGRERGYGIGTLMWYSTEDVIKHARATNC